MMMCPRKVLEPLRLMKEGENDYSYKCIQRGFDDSQVRPKRISSTTGKTYFLLSIRFH